MQAKNVNYCTVLLVVTFLLGNGTTMESVLMSLVGTIS
jgi:hypothetical protein